MVRCGQERESRASSQYFFILAIVAILVPSIFATEFVVGDDKGWTINFDYQAWAKGKEFHVGDTLVFKYKEGVHKFLKVNGTGFQQCVAPLGIEVLISGNDVITLATLGRKRYICGVAKDCENGNQKLAITVLPQTVSPAPSLVSAAKECVKPIYYGWMMVFLASLPWSWFKVRSIVL
ncbi:blue copper protein 1b-like [Corylus avellana]|uniref:blue copper protein 1b-like n=1 Tax=Corylus avellana TaxID=13451 RepID=UPI00286A9928|nr:blue copper protein 1b-like [Corylus avellana]